MHPLDVNGRTTIGIQKAASKRAAGNEQPPATRLDAKVIPATGLAGCLLPAYWLPVSSVLVGAGVVLVGAVAYWVRRLFR